MREPIKQARRQLPIARNLALKYAAVASVDSLREDIVEAAFESLLADRALDVRRRDDVPARSHRASAARCFPKRCDWLGIVEEILVAYAELVPWLEPPLMGLREARTTKTCASSSMRSCIRDSCARCREARLAQFPRYLKAMRLRAERLRQDATRDQARMLTVRGYWRDYLSAESRARGEDASLDELRWLIEELRVSLFAQELKTAETGVAEAAG